MKWIAFADSFPSDSKACHGGLNELNTDLAKKSVLLGNGFTPSEADVIVFSVIHSSMVCIAIYTSHFVFQREGILVLTAKLMLKKINCNSFAKN